MSRWIATVYFAAPPILIMRWFGLPWLGIAGVFGMSFITGFLWGMREETER